MGWAMVVYVDGNLPILEISCVSGGADHDEQTRVQWDDSSQMVKKQFRSPIGLGAVLGCPAGTW